jgi:RNA recognition motif-containing protein
MFVGQLPLHVTEADVEAFFGRYGRILDVAIMVDSGTGQSRGFGFVTFQGEEGLKAALAAAPHTLEGIVLETTRAMPKAKDPLPPIKRPLRRDRERERERDRDSREFMGRRAGRGGHRDTPYSSAARAPPGRSVVDRPSGSERSRHPPLSSHQTDASAGYHNVAHPYPTNQPYVPQQPPYVDAPYGSHPPPTYPAGYPSNAGNYPSSMNTNYSSSNHGNYAQGGHHAFNAYQPPSSATSPYGQASTTYSSISPYQPANTQSPHYNYHPVAPTAAPHARVHTASEKYPAGYPSHPSSYPSSAGFPPLSEYIDSSGNSIPRNSAAANKTFPNNPSYADNNSSYPNSGHTSYSSSISTAYPGNSTSYADNSGNPYHNSSSGASYLASSNTASYPSHLSSRPYQSSNPHTFQSSTAQPYQASSNYNPPNYQGNPQSYQSINAARVEPYQISSPYQSSSVQPYSHSSVQPYEPAMPRVEAPNIKVATKQESEKLREKSSFRPF